VPERTESEKAHRHGGFAVAEPVKSHASPLPVQSHKLISSFPSGLNFTAQALRRNLNTPDEELSTSFREAYSRTLKPHHSFVVKPIFSAAMGATPYRKDFYAKLADDQPRLNREMDEWLSALQERVAILNEFLARKEMKW